MQKKGEGESSFLYVYSIPKYSGSNFRTKWKDNQRSGIFSKCSEVLHGFCISHWFWHLFLSVNLDSEVPSLTPPHIMFLYRDVHLKAFFLFLFLFFFSLSFVFLGPYPRHVEAPRLVVQLKLQLPAYSRATATPDLSHVWDSHHSSRQRCIFNPLSEARDRNCNLMVPSQIPFCCATKGTPEASCNKSLVYEGTV